MVQDYRQLLVWQRGMELAVKVYGLTASFPSDERFGLVAQMNRASVSIPSNLAEGNGRISLRDYQRFVSYAHGSACELETQVELAIRLGFIGRERAQDVVNRLTEVRRMLAGLHRSLERPIPAS